MKPSYQRLSAASVVAATSIIFSSTAVHAYPIDCAIILCMPAGFPSSAECSAAKAEVIRRLAKFPPEPPIQIWRCPMNGGGGGGGATDNSSVSAFSESVAMYRFQQRTYNSSGGSETIQSIVKWSYSSGNYWGAVDVTNHVEPEIYEAMRSHTGDTPWLNGYMLTWAGYDGQLGSSWLNF